MRNKFDSTRPLKDERIKYNFNYLKKNLDIKKFLKIIKEKTSFNDDLGDGVVSSLFTSCINQNNKDPNLKNKFLLKNRRDESNKSKEDLLYQLFFDRHVDSDFHKEFYKSERDGTLLEKVSKNFKLIKLYTLMDSIGIKWEDEIAVCSHALIRVKVDNVNKYMHIVKFFNEGSLFTDVFLIKFYDYKLDDKKFLNEIKKFEEKRISKIEQHTLDDFSHTIYNLDKRTKKKLFFIKQRESRQKSD